MSARTFKSGRMTVSFDQVESRGVLAGRYRGRDTDERATLTHLVFSVGSLDAGNYDEIRTGCAQPLDGMADYYSATDSERAARPTCPACAKKWDTIQASEKST